MGVMLQNQIHHITRANLIVNNHTILIITMKTVDETRYKVS